MIHNTEELYNRLHARSLADPEGFWGEVAEEISWHRRCDRLLDSSHAPFYRWFQGGMVNTCYNAVDRHVEAGRGEQAAIIHDSPVTGSVQTISYRELLDQVASLAGALRALGVVKPKGVVRDNGGHAVALKWTMKNFYNVQPGEVFWSASDVGWVVVTPTLSMPRSCTAAPRSCSRASPWELPTPARAGG